MSEGSGASRGPAPVGEALYAGLDGGGTHLRILVTDAEGSEVARAEAAGGVVDPARPADAATAVQRLVREVAEREGLELPWAGVWAGLAGAGRETERRAVEDALVAAGVARAVGVGTDVEAAFHDAFGDGPGMLLVAGTGSMAYGRSPRGDLVRVGGWGGLVGDEGSGWSLGLAAVRAVLRAHDGRGTPTSLTEAVVAAAGVGGPENLVAWVAGASKARVAALAPEVGRAAEAGDAVARSLLEKAAGHLVELVQTLHDRTGPWSEPAPTALVGGLLGERGPLGGSLRRALEARSLDVRSGQPSPTRGAAALARGLAAR